MCIAEASVRSVLARQPMPASGALNQCRQRLEKPPVVLTLPMTMLFRVLPESSTGHKVRRLHAAREGMKVTGDGIEGPGA